MPKQRLRRHLNGTECARASVIRGSGEGSKYEGAPVGVFAVPRDASPRGCHGEACAEVQMVGEDAVPVKRQAGGAVLMGNDTPGADSDSAITASIPTARALIAAIRPKPYL